jgi:hypothetical protein
MEMNIRYYLSAFKKLCCFKRKKAVNKTPFTDFVPDTTYSEREFPWEDVIACFPEILNSEDFKNGKSCPECGLPSEQLTWIYFRSPSWTWKHLCGRAGPLSLCPKCRIQVQFICNRKN